MYCIVFAGVFLQRYFGMYLLAGILTLDAPALPRAPLRAPLRLCACTRLCTLLRFLSALPISAPVRSLVRFLGFLRVSGACLFCALLRFVVLLRLSWVRFSWVLTSFRFYTLLCLTLSLLLHALGCAWLRFCIVFCMALLAFLLRKALALSFMHISAFCIIFILSNACAPKLSYINHVFSVYLAFVYKFIYT